LRETLPVAGQTFSPALSLYLSSISAIDGMKLYLLRKCRS